MHELSLVASLCASAEAAARAEENVSFSMEIGEGGTVKNGCGNPAIHSTYGLVGTIMRHCEKR